MTGEDTMQAPPEWGSVPGLAGTELRELTLQLQANLQTVKALEEEGGELKQRIQGLLESAKAPSVQVGEIRVSVIAGRAGAKKIDSEKLLKLGVSLSVITAATVLGAQGKPYVRLFTREEN